MVMTMEEIKQQKKTKVSKPEIVCIVFDSIVGMAGLVFIVLGFISAYLPRKSSENWTGEAAFTDVMHMSYRLFGALLLFAFAIIAVIFLNIFAKKSDVDNERAERRAKRLKIIAASADSEEPKKEEAQVTEVSSTPVV